MIMTQYFYQVIGIQSTPSVAGWTVVNPTQPSVQGFATSPAGSRQIYVSSSTGNDSNLGTIASPLATIAFGVTKLRTGFPDQLLLKKGDTWTNDVPGAPRINGLVRSGSWGTVITGPMLFGSYGIGQRPLLLVNIPVFSIFGASGAFNNWAIIGWEIYCNTRDPNNVAFSNTDAQSASIVPISWVSPHSPGTSGLLIEDCKISFGANNLNISGNESTGVLVINDFALRRSVISNSYIGGSATHSQGIFLENADNVLIEENVFDSNGYNLSGNISPSAVATVFNHNMYIQYDNGAQQGPWGSSGPNIIIQNNISARSSLAGLQQRCGGFMYNNLLVHNPVGFNLGYKGGLAKNNVVLEACDMFGGAGVQGQGTTVITNQFSDSSNTFAGGPIIWDGNIIANEVSLASPGSGIDFSGGSAYLANSVTLKDTIIFSQSNGVTGTPAGVVVSNNTFNDPTGANNLGAPEPFPFPNRSVGSYAGTIGLPATLDGFMDAAKLQSKDNWNPALLPSAVNQYIRAGFGR